MKNNIETYSELYDLVDLDMKNHNIKQMAELFLNAMLDWPNDMEKISDYITELESYFGKPLSLEKIDNKKPNYNVPHDSWRHESGSSIAEMIEVSKIFYSETDFEKIILRFISYYEEKIES